MKAEASDTIVTSPAVDAFTLSTRRIEQIVRVLNATAFRANLLALSAGIGATRTGEGSAWLRLGGPRSGQNG